MEGFNIQPMPPIDLSSGLRFLQQQKQNTMAQAQMMMQAKQFKTEQETALLRQDLLRQQIEASKIANSEEAIMFERQKRQFAAMQAKANFTKTQLEIARGRDAARDVAAKRFKDVASEARDRIGDIATTWMPRSQGINVNMGSLFGMDDAIDRAGRPKGDGSEDEEQYDALLAGETGSATSAPWQTLREILEKRAADGEEAAIRDLDELKKWTAVLRKSSDDYYRSVYPETTPLTPGEQRPVIETLDQMFPEGWYTDWQETKADESKKGE